MSAMPALHAPGRSRATLRDRLRGRLGEVGRLLATPLVPDDYLDLFAPLRAGATLRGRIERVVPETADAATLLIRPGADWSGHVPGQYVRIGVEVEGVRQWRAYSLTHGPRPDGCISITVKAVPDGLVSSYLVHRTQPGTLVHLEQAAGEFVLPTPSSGAPSQPAKLLFITAGSGITPVIGMLRNLYPVTDSGVVRPASSAAYDIVVVHVAPSEPQSIFHSNLCALDEVGAIRLVTHYDDEHGVLDVEDIDSLVPDLDDRVTLACGPAGLLEALEKHHADRGLDLRTEKFRLTTLVTGDGGTVSFTESGATVEAAGDRPLLDEAEDAGVLMPSGCRMGVCYGCVLPLREGVVRDLRNGDITTAVEGDGVVIQTCINAAAGPCRIDN